MLQSSRNRSAERVRRRANTTYIAVAVLHTARASAIAVIISRVGKRRVIFVYVLVLVLLKPAAILPFVYHCVSFFILGV